MPAGHDAVMEDLWLQCCNGHEEALGGLASGFYPSLYYYGTKFTEDRELIKDCLQDLFLDLWERREMLGEVRSPKAYLFQAFRNNLFYRIKKASRYQELTESDTFELSSYSHETAWIEGEAESNLAQKLGQSMERLPKRQREALYLRYYENLSYEEIAVIMGLRRQAVANYIQYGIQKLRLFWQQATISLILLGIA